jgi:DNA-binding NarL/FixJ family response regulator
MEWGTSVAKIRVLVVDDQELFARGLEIVLKGHGGEELAVVGIAANGKEAIEKVEALTPDVVLMDVRMPVMDGVEATRIIHEQNPAIKILILTTFDDDQYVADALGNGAQGYVLKNLKPDDLVTSIKAVHAGSLYVSSGVGSRLVRHAQAGMERTQKRPIEYHGEINFLLSQFESLRKREAEILHLILQDYDNQEIAQRLFIAEQTVKNYVTAIYGKIGVSDRDHAKQKVKDLIAGKRGS